MKRLLTFILATAPFLMCFQCGCDEPNNITILRIENATGEDLYISRSNQPWANADCHWSRLPYSIYDDYYTAMAPGELFRHRMESGYVLLVDADMRLRASWAVDSLPMFDSTLWVSDTSLLDYTNCNDIHPTEYTHTFTLLPEHLL